MSISILVCSVESCRRLVLKSAVTARSRKPVFFGLAASTSCGLRATIYDGVADVDVMSPGL